MREITLHKGDEVNAGLTITADDRDELYGTTSHNYTLTRQISLVKSPGEESEETSIAYVENIAFQRGPIKEVGLNGVTDEALLAVIIDRLEGYQAGRFACHETLQALGNAQQALQWLQSRTAYRALRGVEGTNEP